MMEDDVALEGSLQELLATPSLKWIFVGGKGGVGKTTTSCALAVKLAETRESVLLLSTDPAHNLGDAFAQKFSATPSLVNGFSNLYAMEIDSRRSETGAFKLPDSEGMLDIFPQILQAVPGIDEALSFAELMRSVQTFSYSVIVFDTAPTGHTLRLLSFPSLVEKALGKLAAIKGNLSAAVGLLGAFSNGSASVSADDISSTIDHIRAVTTSVRETFQDPTRTTFVCVCIPEFLSVYETERLVQELAKQQIDCSNIVVNHVLFPIGEDEGMPAAVPSHLPEGPPSAFSALMEDPHTVKAKGAESREKCLEDLALRLQKRLFLVEKVHNSRRRMQSKYLQQIQDLYAFDFHVVCMAQQSEEVRGSEKLKAFAAMLCEERPLPIMKSS